jgi:NAD(P)H-flavin reductase
VKCGAGVESTRERDADTLASGHSLKNICHLFEHYNPSVPSVTVPVSAVAAVTPRTRLLTLDLHARPMEFLPGQAVMVGLHGQDLRRPYSIACSPERARETGHLELLIATEPNGDLGENLAGAGPGALVDVEGPMGTFTLPDTPDLPRLLFVAGGTGIAPLHAMIDHSLRTRSAPRISLLYSARRGDEFAFIEELRGHEAAGRIELHPTVTRDDSSEWAGGRGRIGRAHFEAVVHEPAATLCFICGPAPLVSESVSTLEALGVPARQIHTERWGK